MSKHNGQPAVKDDADKAAPPANAADSASTPVVYENVQAMSIVAEQDATITQSGATIIIVGENLELRQAGAGVIIAGENVQISQGGCGFLMAGGDVTVVEGDPAFVQTARGTMRTGQSSMLLAADEAHIQGGSVGVMLANKAILDEYTQVKLNVSFYELAGAIVGLTFLLPVRLVQRLSAKGRPSVT